MTAAELSTSGGQFLDGLVAALDSYLGLDTCQTSADLQVQCAHSA